MGAFHVSVPQPSGQHPLEIWTDEGEVTLGFTLWHAHYGSYLGVNDQDAFDLALADVRGILAEQFIVTVSHAGTEWLESTLQEAVDVVGRSSINTGYAVSGEGWSDLGRVDSAKSTSTGVTRMNWSGQHRDRSVLCDGNWYV